MIRHSISVALQAALAILVSNEPVARGFCTGSISPTDLKTPLAEEDLDALQEICAQYNGRIVAMAAILTSRRLRRLEGLLPLTYRSLGQSWSEIWKEYLWLTPARGIPRPPLEALHFGRFLLPRLERGSLQESITRYEVAQNEVAARLVADSRPAQTANDIGDQTEVRLSAYTVIEQFEASHYSLIAESASTEPSSGTLQLVFHPADVAGLRVSVTRISAALMRMLTLAEDFISVCDLITSAGLPRSAGQRLIQKLRAIHVMEARCLYAR